MSRRVTPPPSTTTRSAAARGRQVTSRRNMRPWLLALGGLVLLGIVAVVVALSGGGTNASLDAVVEYPDLSRDHVEQAVSYDLIPPVGGEHHARWQNCGIYGQPVQNEYAVHSLEHGAVWITYQEGLPEAEVEQLRSATRGEPFVLLSPYPDLLSKVVASAWGVQLKMDSADDPRIKAFIDKYERGPQTPEPGATCRSGVGNPLER